MNRHHPGGAFVFLIALGLGLSACNNSNTQPVHPGGSSSLIGAGSTFIYPIMTRWISAFHTAHQGVEINYQSIGSGGGIQQLKQGLIDFGASDAALNDDQLKEMPPMIQIPESAGPVCITYNLPELKTPPKLSAAGRLPVFSWERSKHGRIQRSRKTIQALVCRIMPSLLLTVRTAAAPPTFSPLTLRKVSPEWAKKVGKGIAVSWPTGVGGKGSEGVTGVVRQAPGAIGYVELNYAKDNNLPVALIRNEAGQWEEPSAAGTTAAIDGFTEELAKDVRTPIVDPPASAKDAYPICGLTLLLVPKDGQDAAKRREVRDFIEYIITTGQSSANNLYYAQLPTGLVDQDQKLLGEMTAAGQALPTTSASRE